MTYRQTAGWSCALIFCLWIGFRPSATASADVIWTQSEADALRESEQLGRPLLVMGVSAQCGPCQELKRRLREAPSLAKYLGQCVVLEMDSQTPAFRSFVQKHPQGFTGMVPMVYLFGPDQQLQYAQPGLLGTDRLESLLSSALEQSGPPLDRGQVAAATQVLQEVRDDARKGRITVALQKVYPVSSRQGTASVLRLARHYEQQLVAECRRWMTELDRSLTSSHSIHASAFRLAEMYVQLRGFPDVQGECGVVLEKHQGRPATSQAVLQAKHLVRARAAEERSLPHEALQSYQRIIEIDHGSPIARYALSRLPGLEERRDGKFAGTR